MAANIWELAKKYRPGASIVDVRFFVYNANFVNLVDGTTQQVGISIDSDSDFFVQKLTFEALDLTTPGNPTITGAATNPDIEVLVQDSQSGNQLMQNPVLISALFGSGELPNILTSPRRYAANSTVQVSVSNLGIYGIDYRLQVNFIGYQVYYG